MASKIEILRTVAAAIGVTPPLDENQNTSFLRQILPIWDLVVDDYATRHGWTWGTQTREIAATTTEPPPPWQYSYALPIDRTLIRDLTDGDGAPQDYEIQDQRVLCNHPGPLHLRINVVKNPSAWPADFSRCVAQTLEGYAWKGLRDEKQIGQALIDKVDSEAGSGLLQKAISRDKRQQPARRGRVGTVYSAFRGSLTATQRRPRDG